MRSLCFIDEVPLPIHTKHHLTLSSTPVPVRQLRSRSPLNSRQLFVPAAKAADSTGSFRSTIRFKLRRHPASSRFRERCVEGAGTYRPFPPNEAGHSGPSIQWRT
jgi:hypothetical protein